MPETNQNRLGRSLFQVSDVDTILFGPNSP